MFFFFKQKTAYEMRISDWSSDVCSSDLAAIGTAPPLQRPPPSRGRRLGLQQSLGRIERIDRRAHARFGFLARQAGGDRLADLVGDRARPFDPFARRIGERSEEHTSELQSLMRNSYAVFCLKKKTIDKNTT